MREKKKPTHAKNSLRTLILFCSIVVLIIVASLGFKLFSLVKDSHFDGQHEFIIGFEYQKELDIVALRPEQKSISHLQVRGIHNLSDAEKNLGIFLDSKVTLQEPFAGTQKVATYLSDAVLKHHLAKSSLSSYDLIRLSLFAKSIPESLVKSEEIRLPLDPSQIDQFSQELFVDATISDENESVEVVNGTGVAGLGNRLGRELSNRGVNVIAIRNADDMQTTSKMQYFGKKTYTVERLENMLQVPLVTIDTQGLSDIIITIGTDKTSFIN